MVLNCRRGWSRESWPPPRSPPTVSTASSSRTAAALKSGQSPSRPSSYKVSVHHDLSGPSSPHPRSPSLLPFTLRHPFTASRPQQMAQPVPRRLPPQGWHRQNKEAGRKPHPGPPQHVERTARFVIIFLRRPRTHPSPPEFYLVAAGDDPSSPDSPIKLEDRGDITAPFDFDDTASPDCSPLDCHIDFPPTPTESSPASLPPLKDLHPDPLSYSSALAASSPPLIKPAPSYLHYYPNHCTAFRLLADGMTPFSVNLDSLLSSHQPSSSALMLKLKLSITSVDDTRGPSALHGFSASISLLRVWTNSAKSITRVFAHNVCVSEESAPIQVSNVEYGIANALLPESALTRCRWFDTCTFILDVQPSFSSVTLRSSTNTTHSRNHRR